ncbi:hypothetical protein PQC06_gp223 [Aeromonas phage LAh10]|uniref:Uncharacterized protein n=1 Tax=Aeromonas phage LAh10 TaxID=2591025 RepID=A0A514A185_9CAUD|nr:hypothetical protein PQC06_gp223 [Aeromonas phage LAh10]QDH47040.1 hypothetical protein LAh10_222 [Aeromonas phage LAh10]
MLYSIKMSGKRKIEGIVVSHNGEEIEFRGTQNVNGGDANQPLYEFLNGFFESVQNYKLDQLWGCLKAAKRILEPGYFEGEEETRELEELRANTDNYEFLVSKLSGIFKQIYSIIPPGDIAYAASVEKRDEPPRDLMQVASTGRYPEETTITPDKYRELVRLSFAIQLSFPIMNQFLDNIVKKTGKEYQYAPAGDIITSFPAVIDMPGWRVLETYIRASCQRQESKRNSMEVVSNDRYVTNIIFRGVFGKLALSFIPSLDRDKNLSKQLNSLVEGEVRKEQSTRFTSYTDNKPGSDDQSIPESYRICQNVNGTEELAQAEFFSFGMFDEEENPRYTNFFYYQCQALGIKNQELAERVFNCIPTVTNLHLTKIQLRLLQLVYKEDIGMYLVPALDYRQYTAAIALAQVRLYEMGYEYLAQLCGIMRNPELPITYMNDEFKLNTKERDQLVALCDLYDGQSDASTDNLMVIATQEMLDELGNSGWESNIEPGLFSNQEFIDHMSAGDTYEVSLVPQIKTELLEFIVLMNTAETTEQ